MIRATVLTFAVAALGTGCSNADAEKARAEALAAKAEAEAARREAEEALATLRKQLDDMAKAKAAVDAREANRFAESLKAVAEATDALRKQGEAEAELMERWNIVAAVKVKNLSNQFVADFRWKEVGNFPHPTFKGGSKEAYGAFAEVLVAFLQNADNFEFVEASGLLRAELKTAVAGGNGKGTGWSLAGFVKQFNTPQAHGVTELDDDARAALKTLAARVDKAK